MSVQIHPTAIVAKEAKLGENVKIGPYCIVDPKVEIGDGSELRAFSRVCDYTRMGVGCVIHEHTVIGGLPQVFEAFDVQNVFMPNASSSSKIFSELLDAVAALDTSLAARNTWNSS